MHVIHTAKRFVVAATLLVSAVWPKHASAQFGSPVVVKGQTTGVGADVTAGHRLLVSSSGGSASVTTDVTATGAIGALNAIVSVSGQGLNTFSITLPAATLVGTITPECSSDGGANFVPVSNGFYNPQNNTFADTLTFGSANPYTALSIVCGPGFSSAGVKITSYTSGTVTATARASTIAPEIVVPAPFVPLVGEPPAFATISTNSTLVIAANPMRKGLILTNTSPAYISLGLDGNPAVQGAGITLNPYGGVWVMDTHTFTVGEVNAISSAGTGAANNLSVQELQ